MDLPQYLVALIIVTSMTLVVLRRLQIDLAALLAAAVLGALQLAGVAVLGPADVPGSVLKAIAGFSQPAVITLLGLFVLTRALDQTGVTRWVAGRITHLGGQSEARLIVLFAGATALFSLVMNNVAAGALLLPGALETSRQTGIKPSKLLIPVAFGSLLGGMATYFTTANIVLSDLLRITQPPQAPLNMLHFLPVGGLIALVGILYLATLGRERLPNRESGEMRAGAEISGGQLEEYYALGERLWELQLLPGSSLEGHTLANSGLGERYGVTVPVIRRGHQTIFAPLAQEKLLAYDSLLLVGREERIRPLAGLGMELTREVNDQMLTSRGVTLVELMLAPHSPAEGKTLKELEFRRLTGFTALALRRGARSYRTDVGGMPLALGDTLLLVGSPDRLPRLRRAPAFFLLEPNPAHQPLNWRRAGTAVALTALAIGASIAGVPTYLAVLCGALLVILLGILSMEEAYQAMEWSVLFQIAGMVAVSQAMLYTGLSTLLGAHILRLAAPFGALGLAGGGFLLAALLTQVMGGQVTALVVGPVMISSALSLGVNPQAIAVATAIGCSASFLTPMAHPVNILMMTPGSYHFGDFFRVGWPLMLICFVVLLLGMKLFWGL